MRWPWTRRRRLARMHADIDRLAYRAALYATATKLRALAEQQQPSLVRVLRSAADFYKGCADAQQADPKSYRVALIGAHTFLLRAAADQRTPELTEQFIDTARMVSRVLADQLPADVDPPADLLPDRTRKGGE